MKPRLQALILSLCVSCLFLFLGCSSIAPGHSNIDTDAAIQTNSPPLTTQAKPMDGSDWSNIVELIYLKFHDEKKTEDFISKMLDKVGEKVVDKAVEKAVDEVYKKVAGEEAGKLASLAACCNEMQRVAESAANIQKTTIILEQSSSNQNKLLAREIRVMEELAHVDVTNNSATIHRLNALERLLPHHTLLGDLFLLILTLSNVTASSLLGYLTVKISQRWKRKPKSGGHYEEGAAGG